MMEAEITLVNTGIQIGSPSFFYPVRFPDGPRQTCFTIYDDGRVTVDDWPRYQWFSTFLLRSGQGRFIYYHPEIAGGTVTIDVDNGKAVYKIVEEDPAGLMRGELVSAEIDIPKTKAGREERA